MNDNINRFFGAIFGSLAEAMIDRFDNELRGLHFAISPQKITIFVNPPVMNSRSKGKLEIEFESDKVILFYDDGRRERLAHMELSDPSYDLERFTTLTITLARSFP